MGWLYETVWSESLWLPVGYTWKDLESTPNRTKSNVNDLCTIPVWVVFTLVTRYLFERNVATPICHHLGIKTTFRDNKQKQKPKAEWTDADLRREKKEQASRAQLKKATETFWRFVFYSLLLGIGTFVLLRSEWGLDGSKWVHRFIEDHEMTWDMKVYYHTELSFYVSLLISQFFDVQRKDFYQMFIHHTVTILLLVISYINGLYRFGVIIMYLHDCADVWLEAAKLANYAKIQKVCDILFMIFGVVFILTRIIFYPTYVAYAWFHYNTYQHGLLQQGLVGLCYLLLALHIYWAYLICKMAYRLVIVGKVEKDTRSESESEDSI